MSTTLEWFKSSYSGDEGGECIEVAYTWHKSSHSTEQGGDCVEVAAHPSAVHIRDSKVEGGGPMVTVAPTTWTAFTRALG